MVKALSQGVALDLQATARAANRSRDGVRYARGTSQEDIEKAAAMLQFPSRFPDLPDHIVALHAHGVPEAEILRRASNLAQQAIPSSVVEDLLAEARREALDWLSCPLEPIYPIITFERMLVKRRDAQGVSSRVCYFGLGFQARGPKEVLGFWHNHGDEQKFWAAVLGDLRRRGVCDALYLVGPQAQLLEAGSQHLPLSIVLPHAGDILRRSLELATTKNRGAIASALRAVLCAASIADAHCVMDEFERGTLGEKYPAIPPIWRNQWQALESFYSLPSEVRRVLASTHAADAIRRGYRRASRGQVHASSPEGAAILIYLAVRDAMRRWKRPQREWHAAKLRLAMTFPERFITY